MKVIKKIISIMTFPFIFVVSFVLLLSFFLFTAPSENSFVLSFMPLILVWVVVFSFIMILSPIFGRLPKKHVKTIAVTIASVVMLLIMFSALGQLAFFDIALLLTLAIVGVFYFRRSWPN
ncbi:hypothetical protein KBB49_00715 [Candidatus Saccharibacteria bacterium]|nr:hypothetical protein [Candidatus Saccharibacteria bacterium]